MRAATIQGQLLYEGCYYTRVATKLLWRTKQWYLYGTGISDVTSSLYQIARNYVLVNTDTFTNSVKLNE